MTAPLEFRIEGPPVSQGRPRTRVVGRDKSAWDVIRGGRVFATVYDPPNAKEWKQDVRRILESLMPPAFLKPMGPVAVELTFYLPRPKAARGRPRPTKGADWDNLAKPITDAMKDLVYFDDAQIVEARVFKFYAEPDAVPGVRIVVSEVN